MLLLARSVLVRMRIVLMNVVALAGAVAALAPLLVRMRPLGHRTHLPRRVARVIPFDNGHRAAPRA